MSNEGTVEWMGPSQTYGRKEVVRFTDNSEYGEHFAFVHVDLTVEKRYTITAEIYIPSTNSKLNRVTVSNSNIHDDNVIANADARDEWYHTTGTFVAVDGKVRLRATYVNDESDNFGRPYFGSGSDEFFFRNVRIYSVDHPPPSPLPEPPPPAPPSPPPSPKPRPMLSPTTTFTVVTLGILIVVTGSVNVQLWRVLL